MSFATRSVRLKIRKRQLVSATSSLRRRILRTKPKKIPSGQIGGVVGECRWTGVRGDDAREPDRCRMTGRRILGRRRSPELRRQRPLVGAAARCGHVGVGVVWPFFDGAIAVFAARARVCERVFAFVLYRHLILLRQPLTGSNVSTSATAAAYAVHSAVSFVLSTVPPQTAYQSSPTVF